MKTGFIFFCIIFILTTTSSYADTQVIGFISQDTTWAKANSPYITIGNVIVKENTILKIEPGVTVKFGSGHNPTIHGTLIAQGNAADVINFIPKENNVPGAWGGIS